MKLDKSLIVVDVETTGLHPERNSVLSIGVVVVNRYLLKTVKREWQVRLANPFEIFRGEYRRAKKVHGIPTLRALFGGQSVDAVTSELYDLLAYPGSLIAGNNVGFDYAFIKRMFEQAERKNPFDYHLVDLTGLAAVHLGVVSLSGIAQALGLDEKRYTKHSAIGDAELTADCFIALLKMIQQKDRFSDERVEEIGKSAARIAVSRLIEKQEKAAAIEYMNEHSDKHGL